MSNSPLQRRIKVRLRTRHRVKGTAETPRLCVFRSHNHIYAQVIDDVSGCTLVSSSTLDKTLFAGETSTCTCEASSMIGRSIAEKSLKANISTVIFDRGGRVYHGRVKALADAARSAGLQF